VGECLCSRADIEPAFVIDPDFSYCVTVHRECLAYKVTGRLEAGEAGGWSVPLETLVRG
jgi:hypothetical protein